MNGILLFVGMIVGYLIPFFETLFALSSSGMEHVRQGTASLLKKRALFEAYKEAEDKGQILRLIHRRTLFIGTLWLLALFLLTSTRSAVGFGVLLGLELNMSLAMLKLLKHMPTFRKVFFWDLAESVSDSTIRVLAYVFFVMFFMTGIASFFVI